MLAVVLLVSLVVFGCSAQQRAAVAHVNKIRTACDNGQVTACIDYRTISEECLHSCSRPGLVAGIKCGRCRKAEVIY
jgi:hypothetical protein